MKTLIEMAREAGWEYADDDRGFAPLWRFAELVRSDEREACAKVCDVTVLGDEYLTAVINTYADAIRNRSNK